jgi:phosphatidylglycerol:prolipoprotein diacylglycerol transferase
LESQETLEQVFVTVLVGALLGARLGYVFVYAPAYFWQYPWAILSPWDPLTGQYTGLSGLSFHGALLGASVALCVWARIQKLPLLLWADRISVVLPLGIFFGRLGNFLNGELQFWFCNLYFIGFYFHYIIIANFTLFAHSA